MTDRMMTSKSLLSYFLCCPELAEFDARVETGARPSLFSLGESMGYGVTDAVSKDTQPSADSFPHDFDHTILPFNPDEVVDNLRLERYPIAGSDASGGSLVRTVYYLLRPLMPVKFRRILQKRSLSGWSRIPFPRWPVETSVDDLLATLLARSMKARGLAEAPFVWFWPKGFDCCLMMTHDVETAEGRDFCGKLMDMVDGAGMKSAFQIVPEQRYEVPGSFLEGIRSRGFEINLHGLNHDGQLFSSKEEFLKRAPRIREYADKWGARGFRSPVLYHNLEWYPDLPFEYDMSVANVGHLDPQRGGCCTVMPYFIGDVLELPLTTTQDYSLFNIVGSHSTDLWKEQMDRVISRNGLTSFIVHPDYVIEDANREVYQELLDHISAIRSEKNLWCALPGEINDWWRLRSGMKLEERGGQWVVSGDGSDRATVTWARLEGDELRFEVGGRTVSRRHVEVGD